MRAKFLMLLTGLGVMTGFSGCGPGGLTGGGSRLTLLPKVAGPGPGDRCAAKIGKNRYILVGDQDGRTTVPVCQIEESAIRDISAKAIGRDFGMGLSEWPVSLATEYRALPTEVGYRLSSGDKGRVTVSLTVAFKMNDASLDEIVTDRSVGLIRTSCSDRIRKLWQNSGMMSNLDIDFQPARKINFDEGAAHLINLMNSSEDGASVIRMAQWPDRAPFSTVIRQSDRDACVEKFRAQGRQAIIKCEREAMKKNEERSARFCADLSIMVAHFLGLAADDAKAGRCDGEGNDRESSASFMRSIAGVDRRSDHESKNGEEFWRKARFSPSDRKTIIGDVCDKASKTIAMPSPHDDFSDDASSATDRIDIPRGRQSKATRTRGRK